MEVRTGMTLQEQLHEAEQCFAASYEAAKTHGHQAMTWIFLKADAERVKQLRKEIQSER